MSRALLIATAACLCAGCATGRVGTVPATAEAGAFPGAPPAQGDGLSDRIVTVLEQLRAADESLAVSDFAQADACAAVATDALRAAEGSLPRQSGASFAAGLDELARAREQLAQGDASEARFRFDRAAAEVGRAGVAAPLAAARSKLLAAAVEVDQQQWQSAQTLVAEAIALLSSIRVPEGSLQATELQALETETRLFLARFGAGGQPDPDSLRKLADRTATVPLG